MKKIAVIILVVGLLRTAALGQVLPGGTAPVHSASGLFVVYPFKPEAQPLWLARLANDTNYLALDPPLLAVSCERLKDALWRKLGVTTSGAGRIYLHLHTPQSIDEPVLIATERIRGVWQYRVELPNRLERDRFVQSMMRVLFLELANRNAGAHSAEVPPWLSEGMGQELRTVDETELVLTPPNWNVHGLTIYSQFISQRWVDPLIDAQRTLQSHRALTFQQLSWPGDDQWTGDAGDVYRSSAQLFVHELIRMPDGPDCLRNMLSALGWRYNWQLAFLDAFHSHFQNALAVEKWWALQLVQFTGRDLSLMWTVEESRRKLDEALHSSVEVRTASDELPLHSEVTLQTMIREWDRGQQIPVLQVKLLQLGLMRPRVAPELIPAVDDYYQVLKTYLDKRGVRQLTTTAVKPGPAADDAAAQTAIQQLNMLDALRATPAPGQASQSASATAPIVTP